MDHWHTAQVLLSRVDRNASILRFGQAEYDTKSGGNQHYKPYAFVDFQQAMRCTPMSEVIKTALPALGPALRAHGLAMSYGQLYSRAAAGVFPTKRDGRLLYAIGDPKDIVKMIRNEEQRLSASRWQPAA